MVELERTQRNASQAQLNQQFEDLLQSSEVQHPFGKANFVALRKLVFLWIIGNNSQQISELLRKERREIVEDIQTLNIIHNDAEKISGEETYQSFYKRIESASQGYANTDMFNIMVCPVFLPGCFEQEGKVEEFCQAAEYVQSEMRKRQRTLLWTPFYFMESEDVGKSRKDMTAISSFMDHMINEGLSKSIRCCSPCCVISDLNEKGQEISEEQQAKAVVMLTVFRNTSCDNESIMDHILSPLDRVEEDHFFTARALSICEPVKSLTLNRIQAVHEAFMRGELPDQSKIYDNWKHTFFESDAWHEQVAKVAHDSNYTVYTAPVYSVIPEANANRFRDRLMEFANQFYIDKLAEDEDELLEKWWDTFCKEYFIEMRGSVEGMKEFEENCEKISQSVPMIRVSKLNVYVADMRRDCEQMIAERVSTYPKRLMEKALYADGPYMKRFRTTKKTVEEVMAEFTFILQDKKRRLFQTEFLLNTGGGHLASAQEEAAEWFKANYMKYPQKVHQCYFQYQDLLKKYFQEAGKNQGMERRQLQGEILQVYHRVIAGSIESREDYMKIKLGNLSDMEQLIKKLGESWSYPVRLINSQSEESGQKLYIMGSRENNFCNKLLAQDNYTVAFKEGRLNDRLEIVRLSERFGMEKVFAEG